MTAHAEIDECEHNKKGTDGEPVHGLPVEGDNAVAGGYVGKLYAAQHEGEQIRKKHGEIPFGRDFQLYVVPTDECADDFEKAADERQENQKRQKIGYHAEVVADDEHSTGKQQQFAWREAVEYAEQQRKGDGQPGHGGIACHHDVLGYPRQTS